jgi:hypothetical protein
MNFVLLAFSILILYSIGMVLYAIIWRLEERHWRFGIKELLWLMLAVAAFSSLFHLMVSRH